METVQLKPIGRSAAGRWAMGLSIALAVCGGLTGVMLFAVGGVLRGTPVMLVD